MRRSDTVALLMCIHVYVFYLQLKAYLPVPVPSVCTATALLCKIAFGVVATGTGGQHHFLSRFFAPWVGINEDPVTGSAHAVLGPYWAAHLMDAPSEMKARQCSRRGGELLVTVNKGDEMVLVAGQATIVSEGHLVLPASLLT